MEEKIYLDALTSESVSVKKQKFAVINGVEYPIGEPWRCAYVNSAKDRELIKANIPEPYQSAIFAVWGNTPTVTE